MTGLASTTEHFRACQQLVNKNKTKRVLFFQILNKKLVTVFKFPSKAISNVFGRDHFRSERFSPFFLKLCIYRLTIRLLVSAINEKIIKLLSTKIDRIFKRN